jgi:hypothetical protein
VQPAEQPRPRRLAGPASNRRWNPICTAVALALVDLITSSVPSTSGATGFSQNTGTPACTPRLIRSGCVPVGAAMTSPSTPASSSSVIDPAVRAPNSLATRRARFRSASVMISESTPGSSRSVLAWNTPIRPTPTSPIRMKFPCDAR